MSRIEKLLLAAREGRLTRFSDLIVLTEAAREPVASGQIRLRLPRTVHDRAVERAQIDEVSLNTFLVGAVTEKLGAAGALAEVRALRHEIAGLVAEQNAAIERLWKA